MCTALLMISRVYTQTLYMTDSKPYLSDDLPTYMGNFMKMRPLFREFNDQKPTHMGGTYPYQQYVMYPIGNKNPLSCLTITPQLLYYSINHRLYYCNFIDTRHICKWILPAE